MTDQIERDSKNVELPGYIRSTYEVSTARFIHKVGCDRSNDLPRDCIQSESEFLLISIGDGFNKQEINERIAPSFNVWKTATLSSINVVVREAHELVIRTCHSKITHKLISRLFGFDIPKYKDMLQKTNQRGLHQSIHTLTQSYRKDHVYLHINELSGKWTLDNLESRVKPIRGNVGAFVSTNSNFVEEYAKIIKDQHEDAYSFRKLCSDVSVPIKLMTDMTGRFVGRHTGFQKEVKKQHITNTFGESKRKNQVWQVDISI